MKFIDSDEIIKRLGISDLDVALVTIEILTEEWRAAEAELAEWRLASPYSPETTKRLVDAYRDQLEAAEEELSALRAYCSNIREVALEVGGVDHTVDAPTMIRQLAARRDELEAKLAYRLAFEAEWEYVGGGGGGNTRTEMYRKRTL